MAFDPDAYLAEKAGAPFDPDAYLAQKQTALAESTPIPASVAAGAISSVPFAKQIGAAGKTALDVLSGGTDLSDALDEYRNERDNLSNDLRSKEAAHPAAAMIGGAAAIPALPLGAGAAAMAAYGGANALSNSEADLTQGEVNGALKDTAKGAALGGVIGGATNAATPYLQAGIGKISKPVADYLRNLAEKKAVAATGATGKEAQNFVEGAGGKLLDQGIVGFGDSQPQIAQKAQAALDQSGQQIGDALSSLNSQGVQVDRNTVLNYLKQKLESLSGNESQKPLVNQLKQKMADIQEQIPDTATDYLADDATEVAPSSSIPISQSEEIKRGFDAASKWNSNSDAAALEANRITAGAYRSAAEDAATEADPELGSQFQQAKDDYSLLAPVAKAAERRASVTAQSPTGGLLDTSATAAGAVLGGAPGAVIAPWLRKQVASRANSAEAVGANFLSNIVKSAPNTLGKYAPVLQAAAARGGSSLGATDYILQQTDPDYRRTLADVKSKAQDGLNQQGVE